MELTLPSVCVVNGAQRSGKSTLIRYIIGQYKDKFRYGVIFSNTAFSSEENYDYIPEKYIHPMYNEEKLKKLMQIQSQIAKENRPLCFVIFDDCLFDSKQWSSKYLKQLCTQVAHYNCFVIISTQYPAAIPSFVRTCSFYSFIFSGLSTKNAMKALYESYGMGEYDNVTDFIKFCNQNTGNYKFLFIDSRSKSKFAVMRCPEKIVKFKLTF